jgi:hypothetical protein
MEFFHFMQGFLSSGMLGFHCTKNNIIVGTFFICLARPDSDDFESLTDELASKYLKIFYEPEIFMRVNEKLMSFKSHELLL